MVVEDTDGYWDIVVLSLQDICNANASLTFDDMFSQHDEKSLRTLTEQQLDELKEEVNDHALNIATTKRIIATSQENLHTLIANAEKALQQQQQQQAAGLRGGKGLVAGKIGRNSRKGGKGETRAARPYWVSKYDLDLPVVVGSEVAFKLKNRHFEEWIQCEVLKILGDGTKLEIRDPEPDENNNPGQQFRATHKEVLVIPPRADSAALIPYLFGAKVLARYPETTTFYPAVVVGQRKDKVRLKFDGEEEVNKETEVERRLVLPFPEKHY